MPRRKSPTSDMDVAEKMNTPLAQRLNILITDGNALKDFLGCSIQAVNQYKLGISRPSLENLFKIADFYGVSTDYLLGRSSVKTSNADVRAMCEYSGLTESALKKLQEMKGMEEFRAWTNLLSCLISDPDFEYFLGLLEGYFAEEETVSISLAMSSTTIGPKDISIFAASNSLRTILDRVGKQFSRQGYLTTNERIKIYGEKIIAEKEGGELNNGQHHKDD